MNIQKLLNIQRDLNAPKTQFNITLTSATADATIYYTTDGSTPTSASTKYSSAISVASTETINAIAIKNGMIPSDVVSFAYTITPGG